MTRLGSRPIACAASARRRQRSSSSSSLFRAVISMTSGKTTGVEACRAGGFRLPNLLKPSASEAAIRIPPRVAFFELGNEPGDVEGREEVLYEEASVPGEAIESRSTSPIEVDILETWSF